MINYPRGTQVAKYDPGDYTRPHEYGFVTSVNTAAQVAYVRYWRVIGQSLRTQANSEGTPFRNLYQASVVAQDLVDRMLKVIEKENGE